MKLKTDGLADLALDLNTWASLPDSVLNEMLEAEAGVVANAQEQKAKAMGVWETGETAKSISIGPVRSNKTGKYITVYPKGTVKKAGRKKTYSLSERAFINEFGRRGQPARPFIRTANEESADEAVSAADEVLDTYLNSIGF